jgi:hypothetical protein
VKSSAIKTQNNQALPAGSRLWTPANLGNDLKLWMRPEGIRPHNGESSSSSDLAQNKWLDSSSFRSAMGAPDNDSGVVTVTGLLPSLVSAGNGATFGSLNAKKYDVYTSAGAARGGSIPESSGAQIDPGTGAFTALTVCRLNRQASAEIPYKAQLLIMSDGTEFISSKFRMDLSVSSSSIVDPCTLTVNSRMSTGTHTATIESKAGSSQIFDNEDLLIGYERDGSGNSEFYNNGTSIGTASNQGADLSDGLARNIYCYVNIEIGAGNIFIGADTDHIIAETIVFNKEDATTRILCEGYLAHKYGRQDKLPSTHKYRYGPPRV